MASKAMSACPTISTFGEFGDHRDSVAHDGESSTMNTGLATERMLHRLVWRF